MTGRVLLGILALVLLPTGCGDEEEGPPQSKDGFCSEWAKRACNLTVVEHCGAKSEDSCREVQKGFCLELLTGSDYAPSGAEACLEAVSDAYSDGSLSGTERAQVLELAAPCDRILTGTTAGGGDCTANKDCRTEENFECVLRLQSDGEIGGTCQVPTEAGGGDSCAEEDVVCAEGFYCDGDNCIRTRGEGKTCSHLRPCGEEFQCVMAADEEEGICTERAETGDACEIDSDCQSLLCLETSTGESACARVLLVDFGKPICENFR